MSPDAITISYKGPRNANDFSLLNKPSMIISMLPKRITQKPQKTSACINPIIGRLKILD